MNLIYSKGIFMRTDIFDFIRTIIMNGIKPNYSELSRIYGKDRRTIKNDETSFIYIPSGMFSFTPTFDIISSVKV